MVNIIDGKSGELTPAVDQGFKGLETPKLRLQLSPETLPRPHQDSRLITGSEEPRKNFEAYIAQPNKPITLIFCDGRLTGLSPTEPNYDPSGERKFLQEASPLIKYKDRGVATRNSNPNPGNKTNEQGQESRPVATRIG